MNTPNKLTIVRIILSPFFLFFLLADYIPYNYLIAIGVFMIAAVTDTIDGQIARKKNQITDFGKFLDPLSDKILTTCALIGFVELGLISSWFAVIIIIREFLVTSLRLVASGSGKVIAANIWGKLKTVSQFFSILLILIVAQLRITGAVSDPLVLDYLPVFAITIATALTVISGVQYIWIYKEYIDYKK